MDMYAQALEPVRKNRGTPYPCKQRDLDGYIRLERDNSTARYVSQARAVNELCIWLDISMEPVISSLAALERLRNGIHLTSCGPDLVIKAFKDLDLAFFNGTLQGNVEVRWMSRTEFRRICRINGVCFGVTTQTGHAQCRIGLNAETILLLSRSPVTQMWQTILHEMCVSRKTVITAT